jgi:hypothetical protein
MANKAAAKKMAIQQAGQEELYSRKNDPSQIMYKIALDKAVEDGFFGAEAQRFADYATTGQEELRKKVGNRIGGILDFDVSDEKQLRKRLPKLKDKTGYYFYDPRDGKYKQLIHDQHGNLGWKVFESLEEIKNPGLGSDKPTTVPEKAPPPTWGLDIDDPMA